MYLLAQDRALEGAGTLGDVLTPQERQAVEAERLTFQNEAGEPVQLESGLVVGQTVFPITTEKARTPTVVLEYMVFTRARALIDLLCEHGRAFPNITEGQKWQEQQLYDELHTVMFDVAGARIVGGYTPPRDYHFLFTVAVQKEFTERLAGRKELHSLLPFSRNQEANLRIMPQRTPGVVLEHMLCSWLWRFMEVQTEMLQSQKEEQFPLADLLNMDITLLLVNLCSVGRGHEIRWPPGETYGNPFWHDNVIPLERTYLDSLAGKVSLHASPNHPLSEA